MPVKSHSKLQLISADLERERIFYFFVTFLSAALLHDIMIFSEYTIGQVLLVSPRHSQDYKYILDSNSPLVFITHCSYTHTHTLTRTPTKKKKKKRITVFNYLYVLFKYVFLYLFKLIIFLNQEKEFSKICGFLVSLFSFCIGLFCFHFNKNVWDSSTLWSSCKTNFAYKAVDEILMHKIFFHYCLTVFHNIVSSHCIHQHTWYHDRYKYNSLNCSSCIKSQTNPTPFWSMVPFCRMDSYLSSITFPSELCFSLFAEFLLCNPGMLWAEQTDPISIIWSQWACGQGSWEMFLLQDVSNV